MAILPIFIPHAGCPHQCIFCNQKTICGHNDATVTSVRNQLRLCLSRLNPNVKHEAAFYGGSFTALSGSLQENLLALTDELFSDGRIVSVRISTRPDYLDSNELQLLRSHHVTLVELGAQSLDDEVLRAAERGHTAQQTAEAIALLKSEGFQTGLQLMVGLPFQDWQSIKTTAEKAALLHPDVARIYPVLVLQNTPLVQLFLEKRYQPLSLKTAVAQAAHIYSVLVAAGVQIIRVGLQADNELCRAGNILAGPFHPAMGELVKARVWRERLTPQLDSAYASGERLLLLETAATFLSQLRGQHNSNWLFWQARYPAAKLQITLGDGVPHMSNKVAGLSKSK